MSSDASGLSEQELLFQAQVKDAECSEVIAKLSNEPAKDNLIAVVETAFVFAAGVRSKIVNPQAPRVACKDKCHWCCHQAVAVTPAETLTLVNHINETFSKKDKTAQIKKLEALDKKSRGLNIQQRSKLNMPCAFLSFGRCSIYEARPMSCRRLTSYDERDCKTHGKIESEKATLIAYNGTMQGLESGLESALPNHQHATLDLTAAALTALKDPAVGNNWVNGKPGFSGCELNNV